MSGSTISEETLAETAGARRALGAGFAQGERLHRYLVLRKIGAGGMGVVYVAFDPELDRQIAIKVLHPVEGGNQTQGHARLLREAQSMAKLAHPNVVAVFDVGAVSDEARDGVFIAMEFVEGDSLAAWLESGERPWKSVLEVFLQAGRGLAAAHEAGLVHRDFKPENVMLGAEGRARVMDFGLARDRTGAASPLPVETGLGSASQRESASDLTKTGAIMGTPAYMSPEQHLGEEAGPPSDQFSFCVALWEALFGQRPFRGESVAALALQVTQGNLRMPSRTGGVPKRILNALIRGLSSTPGERFASMDALLKALDYDPDARRRAIWRAAAAVSTAGVLIGGAAYYFQPGEVRVRVSSNGAPVEGASVRIDGEGVASEGALASARLGAGLHRVQVSAEGYESADAVVEVKRAGTHETNVVLTRLTGTMELEVEPPGGSVYVDGTDYGSRLRNFAATTGEHELWVRKEGRHDVRLNWTVADGATTRGSVFLAPAVMWSHENALGRSFPSVIEDVDADGYPDLLHRIGNNILVESVAHERGGRRHFAFLLGSTSPVLTLGADLDGDGAGEVVVFGIFSGGTVLAAASPEMGVHDRMVGDWELPFPAEAPAPVAAPVLLQSEEGPVLAAASGRHLMVARASDGRTLRRTQIDGAALGLVELGESPSVAVVHESGVTAFDARGERVWDLEREVGSVEDAKGEAGRGLVDWSVAGSGWAVAAELDARPGADLALPVREGEGHVLLGLAGADGKVLWEGPAVELTPLSSAEHVADVGHDGRDDLLRVPAGGKGGRVLIDGRDGRVRARLDTGEWSRLVEMPKTTWLLDGQGESLRVRTAEDGVERARVELDGAPSAAAVGHWDTDARVDLALGTSAGSVYGFDDGVGLLGSAYVGGRINHVASAGDVNRDGVPDWVVDGFGARALSGKKAKWTRRYIGPMRVRPVVADVDDDGEKEVAVFARTSELVSLQVLDLETGELEHEWTDGADPLRPPVLLETEDGRRELVSLGGWQKRLWVYDFRRPNTAPRAIDFPETYGGPALGDVEGDGLVEVVALGWHNDPQVVMFDSTSWERRWTAAAPTAGFGAEIAQLDGQEGAEVVASFIDGGIAVLDGRTGETRWEAKVGRGHQWPVPLADTNGDGRSEIVTPTQSEAEGGFDLVGLSGVDGSEVWRIAGRGGPARPLVVDIDRDGEVEIVTHELAGGLVALELDGTVIWERAGTDYHVRLAPMSAEDLDGDGRLEIIEPLYEGGFRVRAASDGALLWKMGGELLEAPPVAVDGDGDGHAELVYGTEDRLLHCVGTDVLDVGASGLE